MRLYDPDHADYVSAFGIAMAALSNGSDSETLGPGMSWGRVAPGERSQEHRHDELEMFVILVGEGAIQADGTRLEVRAGHVVEFAPFDRHVIENTGTGDLVFLDLYWRDMRAVEDKGPKRGSDERPVFVFSTPPTPNGDLHLGHLSGPYLGADIYTRFQRMNGRDAYHLTGSDDYQSYVESRGKAEGVGPQTIAERYCKEIVETLELLDCRIDQFTITSECDGYGSRIAAFFERLIDSGGIKRATSDAVFDAESGEYLYEPYVSGLCPDCGSRSGGNICEECGTPNLCHDLRDLQVATASGKGDTRRLERFEIDLSDFGAAIIDHLKAAEAPARIVELANRVLSRDNLSFPVSHPSQWGLPAADLADQVIWVWPEMAFGFLVGIEELGNRLKRPWNSLTPSDEWKIVHFFGFDNSFYHSILYPALYRAALSDWKFDVSYSVNEFYLLDNQKFSTSRRHAIWGKEILDPETVDPLRLHLSLTCPEVKRTNFSLDAFEETRVNLYEGRLLAWLDDIFQALDHRFEGVLPDAGDWSPVQIAFLDHLRTAHRRFEAALEVSEFSARRAARIFVDLVEECRDFSDASGPLLVEEGATARARTKVALEFCAARLLCSMAGALMPRFAARLAAALECDAHREWPDHVALLTPGMSPTGPGFASGRPSPSGLAAAE